MVKSNKYLGTFLLLLLGVLMIASCKKYADPAQIFEEAVIKPYAKHRKVILISIDGASGPEIEKIMPTNIAGLLEHSKYTWGGFADSRTADGPSWVNILSGKNASSSGVVDSTFQITIKEEDGKHDDVQAFSTFLQRLLEGGVTHTSVAVSPWANLVEKGFNFAEQAIVAANDKAVKDTILAKMALPKLGTVVVNFNSVNKAGINSAFSADQQEYRDAVVTVDGYIGEIMEALKERENYDREDWLVIITSNHGGEGNSYGGASFPERKVFTLYYQEDLISQEFLTPNLLPMTRLSGSISDPIHAKVNTDDADLYNFGSTGEYTVQLKMKLVSRGSTWPAFFGKKATSGNDANKPGWVFMLYDPVGEPKWRPLISGATGGPVSQLSDKGLVLNEWNTLTMKIYEVDGKRLVAGYTNGEKHNATFDITGMNLDNNEALTLGALPGWISTSATFDVSDIRIYNTALPDEVITSEYCQVGLIADSPYNENLIGYWPAAEGSDRTLFNHASVAQGRDFYFTRTNPWSLGIPSACKVSTEDEEGPTEQFLENSDIAAQIFYWLQIETSGTWNLDGTVWLDQYETEFIK